MSLLNCLHLEEVLVSGIDSVDYSWFIAQAIFDL